MPSRFVRLFAYDQLYVENPNTGLHFSGSLVLLHGRMYWRDFQPSVENSQFLCHLGFCMVCYSGFSA